MFMCGYGAAGRANILINYCNLKPDILKYIADESPERIGRYTPGVHIPIVSAERIRKDKPELIIILAWSYAKQICEKERCNLPESKFIIPFPESILRKSVVELCHYFRESQ